MPVPATLLTFSARATLLLALATPTVASAQVYVVAPAQPAPAAVTYYPRTVYPQRVAPVAPQQARRWGLGLRASNAALTSEARPDDPLEMNGGGLFLRWRLSRHWSLEGAVNGWSARSEEGSYERDLGLSTIGAAYHLTPWGKWDFYLSGAFGGGETEVRYLKADRTQATETAPVATAVFGIGLERRFRNGFAIGAELSAAGVVRSDEDEPPIPEDQDLRAIPHGNGKASFDVTFAYYF